MSIVTILFKNISIRLTSIQTLPSDLRKYENLKITIKHAIINDSI